MPVAVLLVTHGRISQHLVSTIEDMMGSLPLPTAVLEVRSVADPDPLARQGMRLVEKLDQGGGVLILTDAYGSTPSNIATRLAKNAHCRVVAGLNLPMLIKIYNYPQLNLDDMAKAAVNGGQRGVMHCDDEACS